MLIPRLIQASITGEAVILDQPHARRQVVAVNRVADVLIEMCLRLRNGKSIPDIVNMPSGSSLEVQEIVHMVEEASGTTLNIQVEKKEQGGQGIASTLMDETRALELGLHTDGERQSELRDAVSWYRRNEWFWQDE